MYSYNMYQHLGLLYTTATPCSCSWFTACSRVPCGQCVAPVELLLLVPYSINLLLLLDGASTRVLLMHSLNLCTGMHSFSIFIYYIVSRSKA